MDYPTLEEVNAASHEQLCRWYRFLPSPGLRVLDKKYTAAAFSEVVAADAAIICRVADRLNEFSEAFPSALSKRIGWKEEES